MAKKHRQQQGIPISQMTPEIAVQVLRAQTEYLVDNEELGPVSRARFAAIEAALTIFEEQNANVEMLLEERQLKQKEIDAIKDEIAKLPPPNAAATPGTGECCPGQ